jgi:hypothetical protein
MSIASSERDEMDTTEYMDVDDYAADITERLACLHLQDDFFESFFANVKPLSWRWIRGAYCVSVLFILLIVAIQGGSLVKNADTSILSDRNLLRV